MMQRSDCVKWYETMMSEIESLNKNHVWDLIDLPEGRKAIYSKWVFKIKHFTDDKNVKHYKYKTRLVARGFQQVEGIDYREIYSPVVKYTTILENSSAGYGNGFFKW